MAQEIITGYTGTRHITPEMDAAVWRGLLGDGLYVLQEGGECAGSMPSNVEFVVDDGVVSIQGRMGYGTRTTLPIDICTTGFRRIDLIVARYERDAESQIESISYEVIKGDETTGEPAEPPYTSGVIANGATEVDFPLYKVTLSGSAAEFVPLFQMAPSLTKLNLEDAVSGVLPVSKGGTGATNTNAAKSNLNLSDVNMNPKIEKRSATDHLYGLKVKTTNTANTERNGHESSLLVKNAGLELYDETSTEQIWNLPLKGIAANSVFSSPSNAAGVASFRKLVEADIPGLAASKITSGTLALARGGTGADNSTGGTANTVFARPNGAAGAASFRKLVEADIPGLAASKITSGTLAVARGGTGAATAAANRIFAGPASGAAAAPSFRALAAADIPALPTSKITSGTFSPVNLSTAHINLQPDSAANKPTLTTTANIWASATKNYSGSFYKISSTGVDITFVNAGIYLIRWAPQIKSSSTGVAKAYFSTGAAEYIQDFFISTTVEQTACFWQIVSMSANETRRFYIKLVTGNVQIVQWGDVRIVYLGKA